MKTPSEISNEYARSVVDGETLACEWVVKACQRHLDDLEKAEGDFTYRYDAGLGGFGPVAVLHCLLDIWLGSQVRWFAAVSRGLRGDSQEER